MNRYAIIVFWSKEDGAWVADVPDLKSCSAFGATPEGAVAEVRVAINAWLRCSTRCRPSASKSSLPAPT
jgi:predicted RNase H-like HicB family nuclease